MNSQTDQDIVVAINNLAIDARRDDGSTISIVRDISFNVKRGEVVALIGESGSGKTTISLAALGYAKPGLEFSNGEVVLNGRDVLSLEIQQLRDLRGMEVAYLAQSAAATFNPALTIGEQVTESPVIHGVKSQAEADQRALELYRALDLPDPESLGSRFPHQVSGGQLQRLMAAMALCGEPDLLVLDEPTTALDVTTQIEVLKAFKSVIQDQGAAAIYVTHDLAVVAQVADHIVVLYNGEIQEQGSADEIINAPTRNYTRKLMSAVRPPPVSGAGEASSGEHKADVPAIQSNNVTAGYGKKLNGSPKVTVLRDVNVSVERGHTVGIIGESGCGKSTLARVMAGLLPPYKGEILLNGETLAPKVRQRSKDDQRKVQMVFQMADTALNPRQKIKEIVGRPLAFYRGLSGQQQADEITRLLETVELPADFVHRFPPELSGGQKQRVALARALAAEPDVVLCDEVTSALDSIVGANVIELLKRLRDRLGVSYLFITHDLSTVASFADEIVVLYAGRVVEQGPVNQILSPPFHPYTRLLIASVPELRVGWLEDTMQTREAMSGIAGAVDLEAKGCPFYERCPMGIEGTCDTIEPPVQQGRKGHTIACHVEIPELSVSQE